MNFIKPKKKRPKPVYLFNQRPQEYLFNQRPPEYHYPSTTERYQFYSATTSTSTTTTSTTEEYGYNQFKSTTKKYHEDENVGGDAFKDPDWFVKDTILSGSDTHVDYPRNALQDNETTSKKLSKQSIWNLKNQLLQPSSLTSEFSLPSKNLNNPFFFISSSSHSSHQPKVKFKLRVRTRKDFSCCQPNDTDQYKCGSVSDECKTLIQMGKFVNCKNLPHE